MKNIRDFHNLLSQKTKGARAPCAPTHPPGLLKANIKAPEADLCKNGMKNNISLEKSVCPSLTSHNGNTQDHFCH